MFSGLLQRKIRKEQELIKKHIIAQQKYGPYPFGAWGSLSLDFTQKYCSLLISIMLALHGETKEDYNV